MTLPDERYRSLVQTKEFLESLISTKKTPRVPGKIRMHALMCLRHWPDNYHLSLMCETMPQHFQGAEPLDPFYKKIKELDLEEKNESRT